MISSMLQSELRARVCLGCSGEGVIAGSEEIEAAAALTLWVACLPHVQVTPLRLSVSQLQDQILMPGWPEPGLEDSTFLLLADPFSTPTQEVLALMNDRYPQGKVIGGLAGEARIQARIDSSSTIRFSTEAWWGATHRTDCGANRYLAGLPSDW